MSVCVCSKESYEICSAFDGVVHSEISWIVCSAWHTYIFVHTGIIVVISLCFSFLRELLPVQSNSPDRDGNMLTNHDPKFCSEVGNLYEGQNVNIGSNNNTIQFDNGTVLCNPAEFSPAPPCVSVSIMFLYK